MVVRAVECIETDVLVIGAGLAGLRAAIAAREAGARVLVVAKGKAGRSGSSAMTTAGFAAVVDGAEADDSADRHVADTLKGGWGVGDHALVEAMCRASSDEVAYVESLGADFEMDGDRYRLSPSGDHSRRRVLVTRNHIGTDITVPLVQKALSLGVEVRESCMADGLLRADEAVCGATCIDVRTGAAIRVESRAVILATGGAGRLYTVTSNPNDVTGDAFALGLWAGARLRDMEFIQFYPWRCVDPFDKSRVSIQPSTFVHGARLYNARNERFMETANPDGAEVTTRDVAARCIFQEMRKGAGVGAGVRLDLSPLDQETLERSNPKLAKYLARRGIDHASYPFVVTPEAHYWMGGLWVDADGRTTVRGLYCVGEAAGGIHGANRINSNALPETLVFGARAGRLAASELAPGGRREASRGTDGEPGPNGLDEEALALRLGVLRTTAWDGLGIVRSGPVMEAAFAQVHDLRSEARRRGPASDAIARPYAEFLFLCETALAGLAAALHRTESRGAHFREDHPETDDVAWRGSVVVEDRDGEPVVSFTPVEEIAHAFADA